MTTDPELLVDTSVAVALSVADHQRRDAARAVYDALVGAAAQQHSVPLVTCDRRAEQTYRALGIDVRTTN